MRRNSDTPKKTEHARQYNLQLDSKLTLTTKRRHLSTEPADEKGLRLKFAILTNLWLLGQMRQPGRTVCQDLDRTTSTDFLDTLLGRGNFNFYKEVEGRLMISPCWSFCLSYEFELRKEAIRLCKEQSFGVQAVLWAALRNPEHRMKHWLQLVAIPNSASSSSSQEMQAMKKRIADLEKARSRSPRRKQASIPGGTSMHALPAPSAPVQGSKVGKGGNNKKKGTGKGKSGSSSSAPSGTRDFNYIMKLPVDFRSNFHERFHKKRALLFLSKRYVQKLS